MFFLLLAIMCSTCLLLIFKYIQRQKLSKLQVIIVNYFTAAAIGALTTPGKISFSYFLSQAWFPLTILLGIIFISVFYSVALSTQLNGVAITSVAFKLSLVIPVAAAYFLYGDKFGFMKIAGILLALAAILLTSMGESDNSKKAGGWAALLPLVVFIGSGITDAFFNFMQKRYLSQQDFSSFLGILFFTAGTAGTVAFLFSWLKKQSVFQPKAAGAGVLLGIPNYGSAYFLILALEHSGMEPSALWPLNNIGIILLSTASAAVIFRERIGRHGAAGIITAITAIALIAFSF
ncbi:MAG TPA: hypothetical protein VNJ07_04625 [Chitinophagales bacterium]|nr:hypothetical protein [Chitinophagales bacterium]